MISSTTGSHFICIFVAFGYVCLLKYWSSFKRNMALAPSLPTKTHEGITKQASQIKLRIFRVSESCVSLFPHLWTHFSQPPSTSVDICSSHSLRSTWHLMENALYPERDSIRKGLAVPVSEFSLFLNQLKRTHPQVQGPEGQV